MNIIALAGNPNCGKSTLFNRMTGEHAHTGNWAGVTVERREGTVRGRRQVRLIDLPGLYSLNPYTEEERVAREFLLAGEADWVVNLIDARSVERGLYLTMQLLEAGCCLLVAVSMLEEVERLGGKLDCALVGRRLGLPVLPVSPKSGRGVEALLALLDELPQSPEKPRYESRLETAIARTISLRKADGKAHPPERTGKRQAEKAARFEAISLLENDRPELAKSLLGVRGRRALDGVRDTLEAQTGEETVCRIARERYRAVARLLADGAYEPVRDARAGWRADGLFLHRIAALPIFALMMAGLFTVCFSGPGMLAKRWMEQAVGGLAAAADHLLPAWGLSPILCGLLTDGVLGGVGSVLCFLPQIALLFFCMTLLEECGYLARAAFLTDLPLRKLGLTGQSFIPMLMGFGCTTPAVMAARTLPGEYNRQTTIRLIPFLSCGAKLPVYAMFAGVFFPERQGLAVALCYLSGILVMVCCGWFLERGGKKRWETPYLSELPPYRLPSLRSLLQNTGEKCGDFLRRAGTVIFFISVLIWLLRHVDTRLCFTWAEQASLFTAIGNRLAPLLAPLGFGFSQAAVALLAGCAAKEAIVSTLGVLCGAGGSSAVLAQGLQQLFTPLSAASFLLFCVLYAPCLSALATMRRELGSTARMLRAAVTQTAIAYGVTLAFYQCALLAARFWG